MYKMSEITKNVLRNSISFLLILWYTSTTLERFTILYDTFTSLFSIGAITDVHWIRFTNNVIRKL